MQRLLVTFGLLIAVGVLFWFFPLFHVVAVGQAGAGADRSDEFDAGTVVQGFWTERLTPAFDQAADAVTVLENLRKDPEAARRQLGRSAGLGRASLFFVRGSGTIVSVDDRGIGVTLSKDATVPDIVLQTGVVSGNSVRDATGLLSASDYPNSQQFNAISNELNRLVETSVIPSAKENAQVGQQIEFVGCARVLNLPADAAPLKLIPLEVRVE
jgi:predicted lipoprotein